jgi:ABC-type multidrug transport system fused ATPase/permease subunit
MANLLQSGVASAERVFELLDEDEESVEPAASASQVFGRGRVAGTAYAAERYHLMCPLLLVSG